MSFLDRAGNYFAVCLVKNSLRQSALRKHSTIEYLKLVMLTKHVKNDRWDKKLVKLKFNAVSSVKIMHVFPNKIVKNESNFASVIDTV